jgi:hypothetical protein
VSLLLAACGGFLLAVLWFDLMFDVQVVRHRGEPVLPEAVLASIAGYYRRVTTEAHPLGRLVGVVMLLAIAAALERAWRGGAPLGVRLLTLALVVAPTALAGARVVPNAVRLATRADPIERQTALARAIWRDHLACLACIAAFLGLTLVAG